MNPSELANKVFDKVSSASAEADILVNESSSLSLKANDGKLSEHTVKSSFIVGIRVIKDNHVGIASSEATDDDSLTYMVEQALNNARYSEAKPEEFISEVAGELISESDLLCPEDNHSIDDKINFIIELEQSLVSKKHIRNVPYNALLDAISTRRIFTSSGRYAMQRMRNVMSYAYPLAEQGDITAMEAGMMNARTFSNLDLSFISDQAYQKSIAMLDGKPVTTKRYDVIFDASTQHALFQSFSLIWSGKSAQDGVNPWREQLGEVKLDSRLTLIDDPLMDGFGYSAFDDEGFACEATTLVDRGQLKTFVHNSATARHFSLATTANASRGAKSSLNVGLHQLIILPGPDSEEQVSEGEYIEITGLDGLHSGTQPVSGEFSCGASGFLCRNGQRISAIRGITVAGNFYKMLSNVSSVSQIQRWDDSKRSHMAAIRFSDLAISGS